MIAPENFQDLSDEELLDELREVYGDEASRYVLEVLRGRITPPHPIS